MNIPNPVHDLGANGPLLGTGLWTTVGRLWINLAQARVVHGAAELSHSCPQAPSPGFDTSRRADVRVIHTIHRTYYYYWFSLQGLSTKKKQGVRVRERVRREVEAKTPGPEWSRRIARSTVTSNVWAFLEAAPAITATPRVWKGIS